jgi:aminopeptidase N
MMDAMNTAAAPAVIRREEYQPPRLVPEVELMFQLGLEQTRVRPPLKVRNPEGSGAQTIRLKGDGLTPLVVEVDEVVRNDWRMEGDDLLIDLPTTCTKSAWKR